MPSPQPVRINSGTYTQINASGITATSGVSGAYAGPWYILRQTMEIDYVRAPQSYTNFNMSSLSLSGDIIRTDIPYATRLNYIVRTNVTIEKSYETFDTSSYQQPQRFKILAHADDFNGNTYGDLSAAADSTGNPGGTLALGPRGKVVTEQPYYQRRAWTDVDETTIGASGFTESFEGCRGSFQSSSVVMAPNDGGVVTKVFGQNYPNYMGNWIYTLKDAYFPHDFKSSTSPDAVDEFFVPHLDLFGGYATTQESDTATKNWIDAVGMALATPQHEDYTGPNLGAVFTSFTKIYPQQGVHINQQEFTSNSPTYLTYPSSYYKASRHDWS